MNDDCSQFLEDPESFRAHAAGCDECRPLLDDLDAIDETFAGIHRDPRGSLADRFSTLPLAPWEGARHRSWAIVVAGAIALLCLGAAAFTLGGVNPAEGFSEAVRGSMAGQVGWLRFFRSAPQMLRQAPMHFHLFLAVAFISVNVLFYLLLRRDPKGSNVSSR